MEEGACLTLSIQVQEAQKVSVKVWFCKAKPAAGAQATAVLQQKNRNFILGSSPRPQSTFVENVTCLGDPKLHHQDPQ